MSRKGTPENEEARKGDLARSVSPEMLAKEAPNLLGGDPVLRSIVLVPEIQPRSVELCGFSPRKLYPKLPI